MRGNEPAPPVLHELAQRAGELHALLQVAANAGATVLRDLDPATRQTLAAAAALSESLGNGCCDVLRGVDALPRSEAPPVPYSDELGQRLVHPGRYSYQNPPLLDGLRVVEITGDTALRMASQNFSLQTFLQIYIMNRLIQRRAYGSIGTSHCLAGLAKFVTGESAQREVFGEAAMMLVETFPQPVVVQTDRGKYRIAPEVRFVDLREGAPIRLRDFHSKQR